MSKILIIGSSGQLGTELTTELINIYGEDNVVASDLNKPAELGSIKYFEPLDVLNKHMLAEIAKTHKITQIYLLAALLSARGEQNPALAWDLNMGGLFKVLDLAREMKMEKVYWPSSIAAFGPHTPRYNTPQHTTMDPNTVYGITKLAGERLCEYYFQKFDIDVRSLRYPGLIGYKSLPGGGTTDYAVDIYHKALAGAKFDCFLEKDSYLPMMYMPDAVKATIDIMHADRYKVNERASYNVSSMSFSPEEIFNSIKKHVPGFDINYKPDYRQAIAESWPANIDDSKARSDWNWKPNYDLEAMTADMLKNLA